MSLQPHQIGRARVFVLAFGLTVTGEAFSQLITIYESYLRASTFAGSAGISYLGPTPLGLVEYLSWPLLPFAGFYLVGGKIDLGRDLYLFGLAAFAGGPLGLHIGFWIGDSTFFHQVSDSIALVWFAIEGFYGFVVAFSAVALKQYRTRAKKEPSTGP